MKFQKIKLVFLSLLISLGLNYSTFADCSGGCADGLVCYNNQCYSQIEILTQSWDENQIVDNKISNEIEAYNNLPDVSGEDLIASVIQTILGWTMILTIIALVVAGFFYIISGGQDEDLTTAKNIIKYLIIGVLIEAGAYGIVAGVIQFDFFG